VIQRSPQVSKQTSCRQGAGQPDLQLQPYIFRERLVSYLCWSCIYSLYTCCTICFSIYLLLYCFVGNPSRKCTSSPKTGTDACNCKPCNVVYLCHVLLYCTDETFSEPCAATRNASELESFYFPQFLNLLLLLLCFYPPSTSAPFKHHIWIRLRRDAFVFFLEEQSSKLYSSYTTKATTFVTWFILLMIILFRFFVPCLLLIYLVSYFFNEGYLFFRYPVLLY
jgi:hypothetical protein